MSVISLDVQFGSTVYGVIEALEKGDFRPTATAEVVHDRICF